MHGLRDLLLSERGVICLLLLVVSFVLVLLGKLSVDTWLTYSKWIVTALVASKTVTGAIETLAQPAPGAS